MKTLLYPYLKCWHLALFSIFLVILPLHFFPLLVLPILPHVLLSNLLRSCHCIPLCTCNTLPPMSHPENPIPLLYHCLFLPSLVSFVLQFPSGHPFFATLLLWMFGCRVKVLLLLCFLLCMLFVVSYSSLFRVFASLLIFPLWFCFFTDFFACKAIQEEASSRQVFILSVVKELLWNKICKLLSFIYDNIYRT